jgi:hypothetical protein
MSEAEIFDKNFVYIPLLLFPTLLLHFVLVSIEGFNFFFVTKKQVAVTTTK